MIIEKELLAIVWAVNYFKAFVYGRKFEFLNQEDIDGNNMADIFRRFLKNGKVGIFSELPDSEYNKVQQKLLELFPASIKFYKCSYHALDLKTE